ncbi:MAG: hypothetical protein LBH62_00750 [Nitrososphaerota archaeon]|jgi:hypothetical protein|nr:hypothetical protein [Nitrososphaerota archaeon]
MVSIQTQTELTGNLNLTNLSKKLDKINLPKKILTTTLTKPQNNLIFKLYGNPTKETKTDNTKEPQPPTEHYSNLIKVLLYIHRV